MLVAGLMPPTQLKSVAHGRVVCVVHSRPLRDRSIVSIDQVKASTDREVVCGWCLPWYRLHHPARDRQGRAPYLVCHTSARTHHAPCCTLFVRRARPCAAFGGQPQAARLVATSPQVDPESDHNLQKSRESLQPLAYRSAGLVCDIILRYMSSSFQFMSGISQVCTCDDFEHSCLPSHVLW